MTSGRVTQLTNMRATAKQRDIIAARADWMNKYTGLFITCLLRQERYRYSYGRAYKLDSIRNTELRLPVTSDGIPDWQWMENYIKSLPYGDRL